MTDTTMAFRKANREGVRQIVQATIDHAALLVAAIDGPGVTTDQARASIRECYCAGIGPQVAIDLALKVIANQSKEN